MKIIIHLIFLAVLTLSVYELDGQITIEKKPQTIHFEHQYLSDETKGNHVADIFQDQYGFLWIKANQDLYAYDGQRFIPHYKDNLSALIGDKYIFFTYEDPLAKDLLWLATNRMVSVVDRASANYSSKYSAEDIIKTYQIKNVAQVYRDSGGRIWFRKTSSLIMFADFNEQNFIEVTEVSEKQPRFNNPVCIIEDYHTQTIYVITKNGDVHKYDEIKESLVLYLKSEFNQEVRLCCFDDQNSVLWLGCTSANLISINLTEKTQQLKSLELEKLSSVDFSMSINSLYLDSESKLWIGTRGEGLIEFDPQKNSIIRFYHDEQKPSSIISNVITAIYEDASGLMWLGHPNGTISHFTKRKHLIDNYEVYQIEKGKSEKKAIRILTMKALDNGKILTGSSSGLFILSYNKQNHLYKLETDLTRKLPGPVGVIEKDHNGNFWIGTYSKKAWVYNEITNSLNEFSFSSEVQKIGPIFDIMEDSNNHIWFLMLRSGLIRYSPNSGDFQVYGFPSSRDRKIIKIVYCMIEESPGVLLIGTNLGGFRFYEDENRYQKISHNINESGVTGAFKVISLLKSQIGYIFLNTNKGLFTLAPGDSVLIKYDYKSGSSKTIIRGLIEDAERNLWLITNTGISFLNTENGVQINFDKSNGLSEGAITQNFIVLLHGGDLLISKIEGFSVLRTGAVIEPTKVPPVIISDFQAFREDVIIGNEEVNYPITSPATYEYDYLNNIFRVEFSVLDFINPSRNLYKYKMEGINNQWVDLGNENSVTFVNLPPNHYRLSVKGANSEGFWNEEPLTVDIIINPPYWQTWWFWTITILLIFSVVYLLNYQRLQRIRRRNIQLQLVNRELKDQISIREKIENMLRESEEKYRTLVGGIRQEIFTCDEKGKLFFVNEVVSHRAGKSANDLIGDMVYVLYQDFNEDQIKAKIIEAGKSETGLEFDIQCMDEHFPKYLHFSFQPLYSKNQNKHLLLAIITDHTNQRRLEEELRQSQKLEAVGKLAGGIAHDFNNLIAVIRGYSDLLITEFKKDTEEFENIREIDKASERAAILVRQLLAFSRRQILEPQVLNLNELIQNLENMLSRLIPENIELWVHRDPTLYPIYADPGQIEQVILNLFVNAKDAMRNGGKLSIRTKNATITTEDLKKYSQMVLGEYVLLEIADTGVGIQPDLVDKIFEPFFTTKEKGEGTGLGLSTVFGVVKQSNGYVFVDSALWEGTQFSIFFPRTTQAVAEKKPDLSARKRKGGGETILVVEDEPGLRRMIVKMLKIQNYNVLVGGNGKEAVKASRGYKDKIHLLLTDVVMPGMNGRELAEKIRKKRENIAILYMSGYTDDQLIKKEILQPGTQYIQKPFPPRLLLDKIRTALRQT